MSRFRRKILLFLAALAVALLLLEVGLRIYGLALFTLQRHSNRRVLAKKEPCRILCLGESTTFKQYPQYLKGALDSYNSGFAFDIVDMGRPGTNTSVIVRNLEKDLNRFKPHIVVLMMGINDVADKILVQSQRRPLQPLFLNNLKAYKLFEKLWQRASVIAQKLDRMPAATLKDQLDRAQFYITRGDLDVADRILQQALLSYSESPLLYYRVAQVYFFENSLIPKGFKVLQRGRALFPDKPSILVGLGHYYEMLHQPSKAQEFFSKAVELAPRDPRIFFFLSRAYINGGEYRKAEELLKGVLEKHPTFFDVYIELGWVYLYQGDYPLAEEMFLKAEEAGGARKDIFDSKYILYVLWGKEEQAREAYQGILNSHGWFLHNPVTIKNYRIIRDVLRERGITFVCVTYPLMGTDIPVRMLQDTEGIVFVDNCAPFKNILASCNYKDIFWDRFAGFFGHFTEKCNRYMAQHIAHTIMRDVLLAP